VLSPHPVNSIGVALALTFCARKLCGFACSTLDHDPRREHRGDCPAGSGEL
jgi:hypothetical protein